MIKVGLSHQHSDCEYCTPLTCNEKDESMKIECEGTLEQEQTSGIAQVDHIRNQT